jgi:D-alanyl-lipoteichoic acid acyltransferase DltB (MBOAT superfamily)
VNVPSLAMLGFVAIAAVLVNLSSAPRWRRAVFLVANLTFVATFMQSAVQLLPFAALLAFGFVSLKLMERYKNRAAFVVLLVALVVSFCALKKYTFVPGALFLPYAYFTVGMSYVFFRVLHLVIDGYQGTLPHRVSALSYVNYTLNFTSLVSGPIQLYPEYDRMEGASPAPLDEPTIWRALERIVVGFFKVTVVSPILGYAQDHVVALAATRLPLGEAILTVAAIVAIFPLFLYVNFSGYTDFVIGAAAFLRLKLPENFNNPFISEGFIEFFGRWHMTLSHWVKTYIYSPILMASIKRVPSRRVQPYLAVLGYFVAFFVVGLWHGQTSMFVVFGILLGLGVGVNKLYQLQMIARLGRPGYHALCRRPAYAAVSRGLTYFWFAFASLLFWSSWAQLGTMIADVGIVATALGLVASLVAATLVLAVVKYLQDRLASPWSVFPASTSPYARMAWSTVLVMATLSVQVVFNAPAPHIIYKAF